MVLQKMAPKKVIFWTKKKLKKRHQAVQPS